MEELGRRWWAWYSTTHPSDDHLSSAEARCHTQDPSLSVTMLAGNSSSDPAYRVCNVERGQHLFFPILAVMSTFRPASQAACEAQARQARELNDVVPEMTVTVDGHLVSDMASRRARGVKCEPERSLAVATEEAGTRSAGMVFDGYWVALKPLTPGEHVIEFYAKYNSNKHAFGHMSQDVKYVITVQ